jgi:hypothetical protein
MRAQGFRVESICRVLTGQGVQVAPRTYRSWKSAASSARTITDAHLTDALRATIGTPEGMYGRRKMTSYLRRQGHRVAACTVHRLMRDENLAGVIRGCRHRTTIPGGKDARRAPDLLDRDFSAEAPNRKWVTDFIYTRTWAGFVYVALVIDCFSRAIVGWHVASVKETRWFTTALKMALWRRDHTDRRVGDSLIHHSDAWSHASIAGELYGGSAREHGFDVGKLFHRQLHAGSRMGYLHQLLAGSVWTSLFALPAIRQPALVVAGTDDPVIRVVNAHIMTCLLPHAQLFLHPGGHIDLVANAAELAPVIESFLQNPGDRP